MLVRIHRRVELGEPKIEELDDLLALFALHEKDVFRLQITVNDARAVRFGKALCALTDDANRGREVEKPNPRHAVVERLALEELHCNEGPAIVEPTGVVDVDDVRALDARSGPSFAEKTLDDDAGRAELGGEHLDRDVLAERELLGFVDRSHAAATDFTDHAIFAGEQLAHGNLRLVLRGGDRRCQRSVNTSSAQGATDGR